MLNLRQVILSSSGGVVTLDYVCNPALTLDRSRHFAVRNQVAALDRLMYGMRFCFNAVQDQESKLRRAADGLLSTTLELGTLKEHGVETGVIHSCFDWYAINACRFFQLRAFISDQLHALEEEERVSRAKAYRAGVCGPMNTFRDKIAAHFAETDPKRQGSKRDNIADLFTSTMPTIGFVDGRVRAGAVLGGIVDGDETIQPQHDISWSLTVFHESVLVPRVTGTGGEVPRSPQ